MSDLSNRSPEEIQSEIAATRRSLDRKLDELHHRLDPRERIEEVKMRANDMIDSARGRAGEVLVGARERFADAGEKLHPRNLEPYAGWMAVSAIVGGTMMAINGWRRLQSRPIDGTDDLAVPTGVTVVSTGDTSDLDCGPDVGNLPREP